MAEFHEHTFTLFAHTKPRTRLNFLALVRKTPNFCFSFFLPGRKAAPPGAGVLRTKAARRRVNDIRMATW